MDTYLGQHPEIFMAAVKESHFFAPDFRAPEARFSEEDYFALFSEARDERILGESSVGYLYSNVAAAQIKEFNPQAKIIIMLRNPVEMIHSYQSWLLAEGFEETKDFDADITGHGERNRIRFPPPRPDAPIPLRIYRKLGEFSPHVQRFFDLFGRRNIHVIIFDEFKADTERVYRETCEFLEVSSAFQLSFRVINSNRRARSEFLSRYLRSLRSPERNISYYVKYLVPQTWRRSVVQKLRDFNIKEEARPEMDFELQERLRAKSAPDVERLSEMLDLDLTHWSRR